MQEEGIMQPLKSPWADLVVLVRKHDGTLRFFVDYRVLNDMQLQNLNFSGKMIC